MERIWAGWRMKYILEGTADVGEGCFLCDLPATNDDAAHLILSRTELSFAIMNLYPYNTGHTMVAPLRHVGEIEDLRADEVSDVMALMQRVIVATKAAMSPDAFNIGMNLGRVAGAGIVGHLHAHVVPRWAGDTNFMPVLGDVKILPESLEDTYQKIRRHLRGT
jgi:ATP adenylyltransferase